MANIEKGIKIKPNIFLKLSFGTKEILKTIKKWLNNPANLKDSAIDDMTKKMENWDDLWLSYAVASLELEIQNIKGFNNVKYLDNQRVLVVTMQVNLRKTKNL